MYSIPKKSGPVKREPKPGTFNFTVTDVGPAPGYKPGHAAIVSYELVDKNGVKYPYQETFRLVKPFREHSKKFFEYLEDNGIDDLSEIVNGQGELTLQYEFVGARRYLNVAEREFFFEDEGGEDDAAAE